MTLEEYQKKKYGADIHQKANAAVSSVQAEASAVGLERANQRQYFKANPGSFTGFLRSGAPNAGFTEKVNAAQWDRQWNPAAKRDIFATAQNHQNWQNNPREMSQIAADLENAKKTAAQERSDRGVERGYLEDADYLEFSGASPHHAADLRRQVGDMAASEQIADQRVKDLEEEKYWTEYYRYMNLPQSEEYEKYAAIGKNRENPSVQDVIAAWQTGTYDEDMIRNIVEYSRANYDDVVSLVSPVGDELYSQLTEEEVKNYNYLLAKDGKEAAQAYLDFLSDQISRRKGHELAQPVTNIKSPFLRAAAALPGAFSNAIGNAGESIEKMFTGEERPPSASDYAEAEVRESLGKGGRYVYDATAAVGNMVPALAATALGGPWAGAAVTFASAAGNGYASKKAEGYSDEQARTYGFLVGASEALLQYALGGVGAIGGVTDDILMAKAQMLKSSLGRLALGGVIKIGTEVAEEELQLLLEPLFRTMVLNEKYQGPTWSEVWDTAVITTLSTAILEGHSVAGVELNYKAYGDMVTKGRSKQEIVNSALRYSAPGSNADVLATDLAQQIKDGKTVSNSDIGRLYSFMLTEANANKFVDSFDLLDGLVPEAKQNASPANMAMDEAMQAAMGTAGSQQRFKADVSKYENEYAKKTIQNLKDSGLANNSNEFHAFADWLAKISADKGIVFSLTDTGRLQGTQHDLEGKYVDGFIDENGNITLNIDSQKAGQIIVGHEITHVLEGTEFYAELQSAIKNYAISKIGLDAFNAKLKDIEGRYKGIGDPDKEITADLIGELLFTDADFIKNLSVQHRNVFQRIWDEIKYLCKVVTAGSKEARQLEKVKKLFEDAYRAENNTAAQSGVKYNISRTQTMSWAEQINGALYNGKNIRRNDTLIVGNPTDTSVANVISNKPLVIPLSVLTKASSGKDISHSIKKGKLAKLDEGIKNAPITIVNPERNAVVYITNIKQGGLPIIVAFDMDTNFDGDDVHKATSIHLQVDMQTMLGNLPESATVYIQKNELDPVGATNNLRGLAAKIKFIEDSVTQDRKDVKQQYSLSASNADKTPNNQSFFPLNNFKFTEQTGSTESLPETAVGATRYDPNSWSTFQNEAEGGYHPEGANAARPTDVPKRGRDGRNISRVANNAMGAQMVPDRAVPDLEQGTMRGDFSYDTITDQGSLDNAQSHIDNVGFDVAFGETMSGLENGTSSSKQTIVNGFELVRRAYQLNSTEGDAKAMELLVALQSKITDSAQALQAASMMRRLTPEGQLMGLQRTVDRINQNTKGLTKNIEIDPNLRREFLNAESEESRATALSNMYADIGRQIPATFKEKWDNWRYLAMLANPRTHIRNFFGNAAFVPVRGIGNQLSALGQLTLPKEQRTRSLGFNISAERRALVDAAKNDFETNTGELVMSGEKYNSATNIIDKNKRVFQFKPLEAARKGNGGLLEWEDNIFSKQAYVSALAGYLNARGYTAQDFTGDGMTQQQKDDARSFAIKEAQKATYRDANAFSDLVTSIGFKKPKNGLESGINALVEGVLPFKKTPANILVRAFEYSPAGLTKTVLVDGIRAKKGSISANEFIDNMSKGLTGSAVFALGMLLAKWDVIKLQASPEDEEQSELEGRQTYSLEIGGKSITLDWAAPGVIPLFMGVELKNAIDELTAGESISLADIAQAFSALTGPMENMSMLDGLNSTIESAAIAAQNDQSAIVSVIGTAALNYFTQAFPTIFGQIERAIAKNEWVRQTTFIDKESEIPTGLQYTLGRVGNKIPGFDFAQVPYVDAWGRTQDNGNVAVRAANNMLNPSYVSDIEETDVDREIKRLEEATGENFTPSRVKNNKLSVNGKTVFLTEDEFFTYATAKGQNDLIFRESLLNDPKYEALDDAVKGKLQNASEEYAKVLAMQEAGLKPELSEWQEELQDADIQTITDKLFLNAIDSTAKAKGKEQGGGKYDGLAWLYDEGQIDNEMAISEMSNTMQTAYGNFSDSGKAFTADEMIDVYAYANKVDGTSADKLDAAVQYIRKEWPNDSKKALALFDAMEATLTYSMTFENEVDAKARAAYGSEGQRAIFEQMTDSQQSNYGKYVKNSGVTAYEFELALKYKSEHKKDEVKAYLERCGYTYAQQQAILNGLYKQK